MPDVMEIHVEELTELKTSSKGTKYFAINHGQFVCFKPELHPVFTKLQGQSVNVSVTPAKEEGKSARIENIAVDAPVAPPPTPPKPPTTPNNPPSPSNTSTTSREHSIEAQVAVKGIVELVANGKMEAEHPLAKAMLKWMTNVLRVALKSQAEGE